MMNLKFNWNCVIRSMRASAMLHGVSVKEEQLHVCNASANAAWRGMKGYRQVE